MLRTFAIFILITISSSLSALEYQDTLKRKTNFSGTVSINSNGISSIPAFSLGEPAIIATASIGGRFSWDPILAYGLDVRPWFIDNWLHYKIVDRTKFKLRTGVNFSMYFSDLKLPDEEILQGERYWAFEIAGFWYFSPSNNLSLMYWSDNGKDPGTISGHFISLAWDKTALRITDQLSAAVFIQLFYIGYDGNNDGFFVSPRLSASLENLPLSLYFQATQAIESNIEPYPGFKWNVGLMYSF
jgi:hypothetical protein